MQIDCNLQRYIFLCMILKSILISEYGIDARNLNIIENHKFTVMFFMK